jgi:hypothetical protein
MAGGASASVRAEKIRCRDRYGGNPTISVAPRKRRGLYDILRRLVVDETSMPKKPLPFEDVAQFFRHHLDKIVSNAACAFFFAGALACILGVWFSSGEMFITVPVLTLGWIFSALGWWWTPHLSARAKTIWILCSAAPLILEGYLLHEHALSGAPIAAGANIRFAVEAPRQLLNGRFAFPIQIIGISEEATLNYSYHFRQILTNRKLTFAEENKEFDDATKDFYADVEHAKRMKPFEGISGRLNYHDVMQLTQPEVQYDQQTVDDINQGKQFLYNFVVFRYTDKDSREQNRYYDAEFCARYTPVGAYNECFFHNFLKKTEQ